MQRDGQIVQHRVNARRVITRENRLTAPVFEEVLHPGLGDGAADRDAPDGYLASDHGAKHAAHAVPEDEDLVHIHEAVLPHCDQRLAVRVELRLEVDVGIWPTLAVAYPRLLHPDCHIAGLGKLIQDPTVRLRPAQRLVDRRGPQPLDEEQDRMSARGVRACDDGTNSRRAADDMMVTDVEVLTMLPRALLQRHRKDQPSAAAKESDLELLTDRHCGYRHHHVRNTTDPSSGHGQQKIPLFDAVICSRRVGNDGFDENAAHVVPTRKGAQAHSEISLAW